MRNTLRLIAICALLAVYTRPALAETPTTQIQQTVEQVLKVVANTATGDAERREMLRSTLVTRFDWYEMARQSLGKHWPSASGREDEFVTALAEFLGNAYVSKIGTYRDEKILFLQEVVDHERAQVMTKLVSPKGEPTAINYRLHRVDGEWKVYDVVVEDISLVANFRSQFNRILAKGSFDDLLRQLREKEAGSKN
ncbi:MAG TPA: ABC transporter substrate-binding protein [Candidatus Binatia bacterium]|jgi:phospholipid transport system substrate-binding protein